nr:GntR family transcriptional regulator [uncultured Dongia sp.]
MADDALISKRTMADEVADVLRGRILSGRLTAGEPIRQEHVAKELGVSRIPLREALSQLAAEGFVTLTAHKGAVVAPLSLAEVEELFELRLMLEDGLLARAIPHMGKGDFAALDALIDESRAPDGLQRWGALNWRFHEVMYLPADRPVTLKLLKRVHDNIDRYLRLEIAMSVEGRNRGYREHQELVDLARARDIDGARALLRRHIKATADNLRTTLQARSDQ